MSGKQRRAEDAQKEQLRLPASTQALINQCQRDFFYSLHIFFGHATSCSPDGYRHHKDAAVILYVWRPLK